MADFNISVKDTLVREGINTNMGYVNDPTDRGGETIAGIARKFHPSDPIWKVVDNAKKGNFPQNLKDISGILDKIKDFYRVNYWNKVHGDELKSQNIANILFDTAVLEGYTAAIKRAQNIVGLTANGVMSEELLTKLNAL